MSGGGTGGGVGFAATGGTVDCEGKEVVRTGGVDLAWAVVDGTLAAWVVFAADCGGVAAICKIALAGVAEALARCVRICGCALFPAGTGCTAAAALGAAVGVGVGDAERDLLYLIWLKPIDAMRNETSVAKVIRAVIIGCNLNERAQHFLFRR
jgi:hypothetical protein